MFLLHPISKTVILCFNYLIITLIQSPIYNSDVYKNKETLHWSTWIYYNEVEVPEMRKLGSRDEVVEIDKSHFYQRYNLRI